MVAKRKTKAERDQKRYEEQEKAWDRFRPQLAAIKSIEDVRRLLSDIPRPDSPGRIYYASLSFFLDTFLSPGGARYEEKVLYIDFINSLKERGEIAAEQSEQIVVKLRTSMGNPGTW